MNAERRKRVLFICNENCNRSQMAEAFARLYGAGRVEAYSAGWRPLGRVHPKAIDAMRELGYDLTGHQSKSLADLPDVEFDVAATMECGDRCPGLRVKIQEDWNVPCPKAMPLRRPRGAESVPLPGPTEPVTVVGVRPVAVTVLHRNAHGMC